MDAALLPAEIIRAKRDGGTLPREAIAAFVRGVADGSWSDAQVGAMAMAILLRGMARDEVVALAEAMTHSGEVLDWSAAGLDGPALDKHSTGGVGDKISLMLAPMVAACGGFVPMISGRGLGHTGGTLDKLEALAGYRTDVPRETLLQVLRDCGCAIVGASAQVAPADKRLYAIRDVTATVESVPLITASILSKKRAAGLDALVLDVKVGSGAFASTPQWARELATSLVQVSTGAGLPARALLTDMDQVLGDTAGNALETAEAIDFLTGAHREPRQLELTLALCAELLHLGGLFEGLEAARAAAQRALDSGEAAERFARMVAGLGGPRDVLAQPGLPVAPVQRAVPAPRAGFVSAIDVRAVGLAVVALGGGRRVPGERIDPRVGFDQVVPLGARRAAGEPLAIVHAASEADAGAAAAALRAAVTLADTAPGPLHVVRQRIDG